MAEDVAKLATDANVKALAINHLIPSDDPSYSDANWKAAMRPYWTGPLHIGKDGIVIELPK